VCNDNNVVMTILMTNDNNENEYDNDIIIIINEINVCECNDIEYYY